MDGAVEEVSTSVRVSCVGEEEEGVLILDWVIALCLLVSLQWHDS